MGKKLRNGIAAIAALAALALGGAALAGATQGGNSEAPSAQEQSGAGEAGEATEQSGAQRQSGAQEQSGKREKGETGDKNEANDASEPARNEPATPSQALESRQRPGTRPRIRTDQDGYRTRSTSDQRGGGSLSRRLHVCRPFIRGWPARLRPGRPPDREGEQGPDGEAHSPPCVKDEEPQGENQNHREDAAARALAHGEADNGADRAGGALIRSVLRRRRRRPPRACSSAPPTE